MAVITRLEESLNTVLLLSDKDICCLLHCIEQMPHRPLKPREDRLYKILRDYYIEQLVT